MRCQSVGCGTARETQPGNTINYAKFYSRSHVAVIRIYDDAGYVIETHAAIDSLGSFHVKV